MKRLIADLCCGVALRVLVDIGVSALLAWPVGAYVNGLGFMETWAILAVAGLWVRHFISWHPEGS